MPEVDKLSGKTGGAGVPVIAAPTRSRTNLANQSPGLITQAAGHEATRRQGEAGTATPEEGRRRSDLRSVVDNLSRVPHEAGSRRAGLPEEEVRKQRNRWRSAAIAGIALALTLVLSLPGLRIKPETTTWRPRPPPAPVVSRQIELPVDPDAALITALDHLNAALEGFPARSPEQILRQVSGNGQNCMLVWTNDVPSLVYGREPLGPNSLAYTLEDCAEAVSRMH
jgi:hypothetical protein